MRTKFGENRKIDLIVNRSLRAVGSDPAFLNGMQGEGTWDEIVRFASGCKAAAKKLVETADAEKRDLSEDEAAAADMLAEIEQNQRSELRLREETGDRGPRRIMAGRDNPDDDGNEFRDRPASEARALVKLGAELWRNEGTGEVVPALPVSVSIADYLEVMAPREMRSRLAEQRRRFEGEGITAGSYLRAMNIDPGNRTAAETRALSESSDGAGGYTVPLPLLTQIIDKMRAKSVMMRAGMRTIALNTDKTKIAKILTDPDPQWKAELAESTADDMTFGAITFDTETLRDIMTASEELLQDSINIGQAIEQALAGSFAAKLDYACMFGSGTNSEIAGLVNLSIPTQLMALSNGSIVNYDWLIDSWVTLMNANNDEPTAAIMAPRTQGRLAKLKDTANQPMRKPELIQNLPFLSTSNVPVNLGPGSPQTLSHVFVGDFTKALLGMRLGLTIRVLNERYAEFYARGFLSAMRVDFQVEQTAAFVDVYDVP